MTPGSTFGLVSFVRLNPASDLIYLRGQSRQEIVEYVVFAQKNHLMAAGGKPPRMINDFSRLLGHLCRLSTGTWCRDPTNCAEVSHGIVWNEEISSQVGQI